MTSRFSRFHRATLLVCLVSASAARADQEEEALNQIVELNKKALAAYASLDIEAAANHLLQALALCKSANLRQHPATARTHIHLGVVYLGDRKHRELGIAEFRAAIAIDPKIRITKSLLNPEVQAAFEEALAAKTARYVPPTSLPFPDRGDKATATGATAGLHPIASGINHPPVTESLRGKPVPIKAHVPPGLDAAKVILAYRAEDAPEYLAREMLPVGGGAVGWFHESIPAEATKGSRVSYYIEARDENDDAIARSGTPESAHHVALGLEMTAEEVAPNKPPGADAAEGSTRPAPVPPPGFWFVLAVGSGGGYHSGTPELHGKDTATPPGDVKASGFASARLLHLAPEIGFFQNDHVVISVQGRFQYVTGVNDAVIAGKPAEAPDYALAGLAKITWLLDRTNLRFRPFLAVQAGVGQIRHVISLPANSTAAGCDTTSACKDSVVGGMGLAGVGTGFTYGLNESLALYSAFNLIASAPNFMVNGDLNVGLAVFR